MLKVLTDIFLAVDAEDLSALVLLDVSAFDTVDHSILLHRLDSSYQIVGSVQQWFQSYLSNRLQHERVGFSSSSPCSLNISQCVTVTDRAYQPSSVTKPTFRQVWRYLDIKAFAAGLEQSDMEADPSDDVNTAFNQYD